MRSLFKYVFLSLIVLSIIPFSANAATYVDGVHVSVLDATDDSSSGPFNIGLTFPFYGTGQTQFYVTTNGVVSFGGGTNTFTNTILPSSSYDHPAVFPFWDDLHPTGSSNVNGYILYRTIAAGEYGNPYGVNVLVVQWTNYGFYNSELVMGTFQVHLVEDGRVVMNYNDLIAPERSYGQQATIGIQQTGSGSHMQHSIDTDAGIRSGSVISYTYNGGTSYTSSGATTTGFWDMLLYKESSVQPPGKATGPTPTVGATASTSPTLSWNAADNAIDYNVVVSTNSNLNSPIYNQVVSDTSVTVSGLSPGTTYYWQVIARNTGGETPSDQWSFTTSSNIRTLIYTAGEHGLISGTSPQNVVQGGSGSQVTAVPDTGYHFVQWSDSSTVNPRTDTNVQDNISVEASFAINVYSLSYSAEDNGHLTGDLSQSVAHGSNGTAVTAYPDHGYHFAGWSDDLEDNPRTDINVNENVTVSALFTANQPPTTPGSFTSPISNQMIMGGQSLTVEWGTSSDPEAYPITYDLWFFNGTWSQIGNLLNASSMEFTLPEDNTNDARFRVYANDTLNDSSPRDVIFTIDSLPPEIVYGTNGNNTYANSHSSIVTATDGLAGISQMAYAWTQNEDVGSVLSWNVFANGDTLEKGSVDGDWYLHIRGTDNAGNTNYSVSSVFKLDNSLPVINIDTNGSSTYARSHTTSVTATDVVSGIKELAFSWTQEQDLSSVLSWTTFNSGDMLIKDSANGDWYLHVKATDNTSNIKYSVSDAFLLDNDAPVYSWISMPTDASTGDTVILELNVTDLSSVVLYNVTVDGEEHQMNNNSGNYSWTIDIPASDSGILTSQIIYNCTFVDIAGNINSTGDVLMNVSILPIASFSADVTRGVSPLTVSFLDNSSGLVENWSWDFGDGNTSAEQSPMHTFDMGNYTVSLTVTNQNGTSTKLLNVRAASEPEYVLTPEEAEQISIYGEELNFSVNSTLFSSFEWLINGAAPNSSGIIMDVNANDSSLNSYCLINTSQYTNQSDFFTEVYNVSVLVSNQSIGRTDIFSWEWTVTNSTANADDICFVINRTANITIDGNTSIVKFNTSDDVRTDNNGIPSSIIAIAFNTSSNATGTQLKIEVLDRSTLDGSETDFSIESVYQYLDISFSNNTLVNNMSTSRNIEFRVLNELDGGTLVITSVRLRHGSNQAWETYIPELVSNDGIYSYYIVYNVSGFSPFAITANYAYPSVRSNDEMSAYLKWLLMNKWAEERAEPEELSDGWTVVSEMQDQVLPLDAGHDTIFTAEGNVPEESSSGNIRIAGGALLIAMVLILISVLRRRSNN